MAAAAAAASEEGAGGDVDALETSYLPSAPTGVWFVKRPLNFYYLVQASGFQPRRDAKTMKLYG